MTNPPAPFFFSWCFSPFDDSSSANIYLILSLLSSLSAPAGEATYLRKRRRRREKRICVRITGEREVSEQRCEERMFERNMAESRKVTLASPISTHCWHKTCLASCWTMTELAQDQTLGPHSWETCGSHVSLVWVAEPVQTFSWKKMTLNYDWVVNELRARRDSVMTTALEFK